MAYELDGKTLDYLPQEEGALGRVTPVYEEVPGFEEDISGCRDFAELPDTVRAYVERLEELAGARISFVSVGPGREQTIER